MAGRLEGRVAASVGVVIIPTCHAMVMDRCRGAPARLVAGGVVAVVLALACVAATVHAAPTRGHAAAVVPEIWIIPHSHDDTGWQRTVDEYHVEDVRYIITETVRALMANRNRTFVQVRGCGA